MALTNQDKKLFNDIFSASLQSPNGLKAARFRADNEQLIPQLDKLERLGYLRRTNGLYSVNLLAFVWVLKENPKAKSLVKNSNLIFGLLQDNYRANLEKMLTVSDIAGKTSLSEDDVKASLNIITQTHSIGSYTSNNVGEVTAIAPAESILKYKSFKDILNELQESEEESNKRSQESIKPNNNRPENPIEQTNVIPIQLFDAMQFHPRMVKVCRKRFQDGNYTDAIYRAYVELNNFVKEKSRLKPHELRGMKESQIMAKVFDVSNPIIKLNELQTDTDISEQEGFRFLFMGATIGIRNPKAHENISQSDHKRTLEYLGFASLLMRQVDEGNIVRTSQPRNKWDWEKFLTNIKARCDLKIVSLAENLQQFTLDDSDSISWGTGTKDGSFTFRKLGSSGMSSVFTMYSNGWVYINFNSLRNKHVPDTIMESFRVYKIPN